MKSKIIFKNINLEPKINQFLPSPSGVHVSGRRPLSPYTMPQRDLENVCACQRILENYSCCKKNDAYRHILPTFTNKAVHEMKSQNRRSLSDLPRRTKCKSTGWQDLSIDTELSIIQIKTKSQQIST
jgi:hypothetical protein